MTSHMLSGDAIGHGFRPGLYVSLANLIHQIPMFQNLGIGSEIVEFGVENMNQFTFNAVDFNNLKLALQHRFKGGCENVVPANV